MPQNAERTLGDIDPTLINKPFRYFFKKHKLAFAAGISCLAVTNTLDAIPPLLIGKTLDAVASNPSGEAIYKNIGLLVCTIAVLALFRFLWRICWGRFSHTCATEVRDALYEKFLSMGPQYLQKRTVGDFMSIMANDVNVFRMGIGPGVLVLFDVLIILCIVPPLMLSLSLAWTWKTMILMPIVPFIVYRLLKLITKNFALSQKSFGELSGKATEIVSGIRVIKSYAQENNQTDLYNRYNSTYEQAMNRVARVDSMFSPSLEVAVAAGCVILLAVGAPEVIAGAVSLGAFFAFYQYVQRMVWPMEGLAIALSHIQQARASWNRIAEVLRQPTDIPDHGQTTIRDFQSLRFENVDFAYEHSGPKVLSNVSFELKAGEVIGITGATGSGKSTLVDLICRHFTPQRGHILINNMTIENIPRHDLRRLIAVAPQETFVFSRKVSENVALGLDQWDLESVEQAVQVVQLDQEIRSLKNGYDTYLGERGVNLSGGQRQRLSLARALICASPLVIFDDSLSAVDTRTEASILSNLKNNLQNATNKRATALIVSHRVGSLQWADRILVLNGGTIEAVGTHAELMRTSKTYQDLFHLQSKNTTEEAQLL